MSDRALWSSRFALTLLGGAGVSCALSPELVFGHFSGDTLLLLSGSTLFAGWLVMAPTLTRPSGGIRTSLLPAALVGLATLLLLAWRSPLSPLGAIPLQQALGVTILIFALSGLSRLIAFITGDHRSAAWWALALASVAAAGPLWLGPLIDTPLLRQAVVTPVIAASPLSYLATLADWDYLRGEWFYRHSPFGGVRYSYPTPLEASLGYLALGILSWSGRWYRSFVRRGRGNQPGKYRNRHPMSDTTSIHCER